MKRMSASANVMVANAGTPVNGEGRDFTAFSSSKAGIHGMARAAIVGRTPLGRPGRPEDVEGIMVYLASAESSYDAMTPRDPDPPLPGRLRAP